MRAVIGNKCGGKVASAAHCAADMLGTCSVICGRARRVASTDALGTAGAVEEGSPAQPCSEEEEKAASSEEEEPMYCWLWL